MIPFELRRDFWHWKTILLGKSNQSNKSNANLYSAVYCDLPSGRVLYVNGAAREVGAAADVAASVV